MKYRRRTRLHQHLKRALVPCRENGQWPHLLKRNAVLGALALVVMLELGFLTQQFTIFGSQRLTATVLPGVVAALTNTARAQSSLGALATNTTLSSAAQAKANDMAARGYFAHIDPDGKPPWVWFKKFGYDYKLAGENLAVNFSDSDKLVAAWLASPTHQANIMKQGYTEIGIGMATGTYQGRQTIFVVQFFGTQRLPAQAGKVPAQVAGTVRAAAGPGSLDYYASTSTVKKAVVPGGKVLGVETASMSLWNKIQASPATYLTYALLAFLGFFAALLILAFLPLPRGWPHPSAIVNGLAVIAVVLGILLLNNNLLSTVQLPADNQNASAVSAL